MQLRNFSVKTPEMEGGVIVLAVSDDLTHLLIAVTDGEPLLKRISIEECTLTGVYFGVDDSTWSPAFMSRAE